jgi:hypothetical protein
MKPMMEIVKSPRWQKVRESLLGKWKSEPEWCCQQLRDYISPLNKATVTELRIMMNYLTITPIRMGKIKHPCINALRAEVSMEMKKRKAKGLWK